MGYVYLLCVALMFSFGGTCVKLISPYYAPEFITFFRFIRYFLLSFYSAGSQAADNLFLQCHIQHQNRHYAQ